MTPIVNLQTGCSPDRNLECEISRRRSGDGAQSSQSQIRKPEESMVTIMFEVHIRDFKSKVMEYAIDASQISTSINMDFQQAQAEVLALRVQSSCTRRDTPPPDSERPGPSASSCPPPMIS